MGRADARKARKRGARKAKRKRGIRRLFSWKLWLGAFLGVCLLGIAGFLILYAHVQIPDGANKEATAQSSVYRLPNGKVLARAGTNRQDVHLDRVPRKVQLAFVAAENKTFYQDSGVDLKGTARGILNTLMGKGAQGGSTLTQQYVKNYYLTQNQTVDRKLREIIISLKLGKEKTKDQILEGYLNTSYFGRSASGIQAAAQAYYRVDVEKLTISQGAYLASLMQAPSEYDWAVASKTGQKLVKQRWAYTLNNMEEMGWITHKQREAQVFDPPMKPKPPAGQSGETGYFIDAAKRELVRDGVDEASLERGGWDITLNIDPKRQKKLEKAVHDKLTADLDPKKRAVDAHAQLGAVSVDPKTGKVLALYGGSDFATHAVSNATRADYQPASTFKPVILAAAMENGAHTQDGKEITPATIYDGSNRRPVKGTSVAFAPPNEDEHDYGNISVQTAMDNSVNAVFAQMGADVGLDELKKTAVKLGMDGDHIQATPAMTLGSMTASPMQMAGVYATFDNHGRKVTPSIVAQAKGPDGAFDLPDPIGDQVLDRHTADTVTSVLTGVVDDGTASEAVRDASYHAAGKTGTSDDNKSAWFTGYTPSLVTSVGMFGEDMTAGGKQVTLKGTGGGGRVNGGGYPATVWASYTQSALGSRLGEKFDLDTDMGAGVVPSAPPSPSITPTPPSSPPSPTHTSEAPPTPSDTASGPSGGPSGPTPSDSASPPDPEDSGGLPGGGQGDQDDGLGPQLGGETPRR
ncbi:transglycosylase domain-containing protein [Streptomyces sp. NPDC059740]|uniref:transglycosylase domain-containing protein n=1 Tax=Streptomyces sp. NPDC059740 TaxID=3346926 RepID=UPI0036536845